MPKRKSTGKRLRFEVFKRDGFICQYCGASPPAVILHVDHIHPVAEGGSNDIDNLITACQSCNSGKAAIPLTSVPEPLAAKAAQLREKEDQLRGYQDLMRERASRLDDETWEVIVALTGEDRDRFPPSDFLSIRRFVERLGLYEVLEAAEVAAAKRTGSEYQRFRYFCGVCWNKIRRGQDALAEH